MRILHFHSTMRPEEGGVVKAVSDLCLAAAREGAEVHLATFGADNLPEAWRSPSPPAGTPRVHALRGARAMMGRLDRAALDHLRELIAGVDVVHLHAMWAPPNPQIARLCTSVAKPYVLSVHGMLDDWCMSQRRLKKVFYLKTSGRNLLRDATAVHCTAQAELSQASRWFSPSKGRVVGLPMDLSPYADPPPPATALEAFPSIDPGLPVVLFLSRVHYKKGLDRLIRASGLLHERGVEHQLLIAGTGDEAYTAEMKRLAEGEGLTGIARFLGFASGDPKVALLAMADVLALPTSQENFGFVFFEALAAGTTVLTTPGVDTWKEIEASGAGRIVDATPEAFARALDEILSDRAANRARGLRARAWAMNESGLGRVGPAYVALYRETIGARP